MDDLRVDNWENYIGQERLKRELEVHIESALMENVPMDHVLLCGPPGAGKTSIATIIAEQLGEQVEIRTMPLSERALIQIVNTFQGVLVLDEIHRASKKEQEMLLPLLEFGYVEDKSGRKHEALDGWLTIVGATTERQDLIDPLVDRFPIQPEYEDYSDEEMAAIVRGMAAKTGFEMDEDTALAFGVASAGTPRQARNLVLSYKALHNSLRRTPTIEEVLDLCRTESDGLTSMHMKYLQTLHALGGSKGLNVLCSLLRQPSSVLQDLERNLVKGGYVTYGDRGRELTGKGMQRVRSDMPTRNPRKAISDD